jgi:hypothetical protein
MAGIAATYEHLEPPVVYSRTTHRVYESRKGFKDEALYTGAAQPYGEIFVMKYVGAEVEQLTDNQWERRRTGMAAAQDEPAQAAAPAK